MKRYFEFRDEKSHKFWEVELTGDTFTTRYGKIGTAGQASSKSYDSDDAAAKECEKLVRDKLIKGYKEGNSSEPLFHIISWDDFQSRFPIHFDAPFEDFYDNDDFQEIRLYEADEMGNVIFEGDFVIDWNTRNFHAVIDGNLIVNGIVDISNDRDGDNFCYVRGNLKAKAVIISQTCEVYVAGDMDVDYGILGFEGDDGGSLTCSGKVHTPVVINTDYFHMFFKYKVDGVTINDGESIYSDEDADYFDVGENAQYVLVKSVVNGDGYIDTAKTAKALKKGKTILKPEKDRIIPDEEDEEDLIPEKPTNVPDQAQWHEHNHTWYHEEPIENEMDRIRRYNADGMLIYEREHLKGRKHGKSTWFKVDNQFSNFPPQKTNTNVLRIEQVYVNGYCYEPSKFFDAVGNEINRTDAIAYDSEQSHSIETELLKSAYANDVKAMVELSVAYYDGEGIPQDYGCAIYWINKTVEAGSPRGMQVLGEYYLKGEAFDSGFKTDNYTQCKFWFEKSSLAGDARGTAFHGMLYLFGWGVDQDFNKAEELLLKADEMGSTKAVEQLVKLYNRTNNQEKELFYLRKLKTVDELDDEEEERLDILEEIDEKNNRPDIQSEAVRAIEAIVFDGKGAKGKKVEDYLKLAQCYREGIGTHEDREMVTKVLEAGQGLKDPEITFQLALNKYQVKKTDTLEDIDKNQKEALKLFEKTVKLSNETHAEAYCWLGRIYAFGYCGVRNNPAKGNAFLEKAFELGSKDARFYLAKSYQHYGKYEQAFSIFNEVLNAGDKRAAYEMAYAYNYGAGIKQNEEEAIRLYEISIQAGINAEYSQKEINDIEKLKI